MGGPVDPGPGTFWPALPAAERDGLRAIGRTTAVPVGGILCHQGVLARDVIVVSEGYAKEFYDSADGQESIVDLLGPGDLEANLAPWGHPQRATLMALTEVRVLRVDGPKFAGLVASNPRIADALVRTIAT